MVPCDGVHCHTKLTQTRMDLFQFDNVSGTLPVAVKNVAGVQHNTHTCGVAFLHRAQGPFEKMLAADFT